VRSLNSVKIISSDEDKIKTALSEYAASLKKRREVQEVYLCGSRAKGRHSPYSDVDLLIIIRNGDPNKPHERVPDFLPDRFPVSLDLFIYTQEEIQKNKFAQGLLSHGKKIS